MAKLRGVLSYEVEHGKQYMYVFKGNPQWHTGTAMWGKHLFSEHRHSLYMLPNEAEGRLTPLHSLEEIYEILS